MNRIGIKVNVWEEILSSNGLPRDEKWMLKKNSKIIKATIVGRSAAGIVALLYVCNKKDKVQLIN